MITYISHVSELMIDIITVFENENISSIDSDCLIRAIVFLIYRCDGILQIFTTQKFWTHMCFNILGNMFRLCPFAKC